MKTIVGGRQCGKTVELIKTAYDTDAAIICANRDHALDIKSKAKEMKLNPERLKIFTLSELCSGALRDRRYNGIIIDDGEMIFQQLLEQYINVYNIGFTTQYVTPSRIMPSRITDRSDFD